MSKTVSIKLSDETHEAISLLAKVQKTSVAAFLRQIIESSITPPLQKNPADNGLMVLPDDFLNSMAVVELFTYKAARAAAKAQFLSNMAVSFSADVARQLTAGHQVTTDEKNDFMTQVDTWAEQFANQYMTQDLQTEQQGQAPSDET